MSLRISGNYGSAEGVIPLAPGGGYGHSGGGDGAYGQRTPLGQSATLGQTTVPGNPIWWTHLEQGEGGGVRVDTPSINTQ